MSPEFIEQTRLAHARVGHNSNDLTVPCLSLLGRMLERIHLALASDEFRQASARGTLKPGAQRAGPGNFKHLDRLGDAFDVSRPECPESKVTFAELARSVSRGD